ncbi:MAG: hypothetical protein ACREUX_22330 [Burkholderiales bacterium]
MDDIRLARYAAGWEPGTWHRTLAEQELKRRHERPHLPTPWIVIGVSAAAVLFTVVAL